MFRTLTTATAIATTLATFAAMPAAGQVNMAPQPKVDIAPNVPNIPTPRVRRPDIIPDPDTSRLREQDPAEGRAMEPTAGDAPADNESDNKGGPTRTADDGPKNDRGETLADHAPIPPAFPATLVKAMDLPPFKPGPEREAKPGPLPSDDDRADDRSGDLAGAGNVDTGGPDDDSLGTGNTPSLGQSDADRLREQFRGGVGVERAEELARLKEMQEHGWLEFGEGAFGGDGDCGPGVNLPAGADLHGLGCGGSEARPEGSATPNEGPRFSYGPTDPRGGRNRHPMPSPDDGMGGNREHDNAWINGGGGSAKGNAGVRDFGQGAAQQGGCSGRIPDAYGTVTYCGTGADGTFYAKGRKDTDDGYTTWEVHGEDDLFWFVAEMHDADGDTTGYYQESTQSAGGKTRVVKETLDEHGNTVERSTTIKPTKPEDGDDDSAGGEAGRSDPRGDPQGGGGAGGDCLTLGIRCDVAEGESGETWGEKMKEWARTNGLGSGGLTPGKAMEQAGQPVPVPGRDSATGEVADPRTEAGLTPGCDAGPGGCAGGGDGGVAGSEAAGAAADDALDDARVDGSIAGMTPGCDASPDGCGGSTGAAAEAGVESGAGEAAR